MRVVLDRDRILAIVTEGGVDIGALPAKVGLERLRWNGANLVDLMDLTAMYVEPLPGASFCLHAVEVPGSQLVAMTYADRRRLTIDAAGAIRLKTEQELQDEATAQQARQEEQVKLLSIALATGSVDKQLYHLRQLVILVIYYVLTGNATAKTLLTELLNELKDIYTPAEVQSSLKTMIAQLRALEESFIAKSKA